MTRPQITAAQILNVAMHTLIEGRSRPTVARYEAAHDALAEYFEAVADRVFTDAGRAMLEVERAIEPHLAAIRVGDAEDLLYALPGFVALDRSSMPSAAVRAQLRFADVAGRLICAERLVDISEHRCAVWELEGALRRARAGLKAEGARR